MIHNFIREDHKQIQEDVKEMKSFREQFEALKLERDALWVKTQEDERIINELRDAVDELKRWKEEALVVMGQWDKVSDYINKNGDVNDLGKSVPELCLKYLKKKDKVND